ncbi:MAG TPA: hypothetical protein ENK77_03295 [Epsilonproteobacteria bacterium]|nr:hypothetical protein [Campylobacterota bacterium]
MKRFTSLLLLTILLFLSACSSRQPLQQTYHQKEMKEGEYSHSYRPSIQMEEKREERFEQQKEQK